MRSMMGLSALVVLVAAGCGSDGGGSQDIAQDTSVPDTSVPEVTPTVCTIEGETYAANSAQAGNTCAVCQPALDADRWSPSPDGLACDDHKVCDAGACLEKCFIDGALREVSATELGNSCRVCDPTRSTTSWSTLADGALCDVGTCIGTRCVSAPTVRAVTPQCAPNDGSGLVHVTVTDFWEAGGTFQVNGVDAASVTPANGAYDVVLPVLDGVTGLVDVSAKNVGGVAGTLPQALDLFAGFGLVFSQRATTSAPSAFAVGDVDGDAHADVAYVVDGTLYLERDGAADGTFAQLDTISGAIVGGAVAIGDVGGDGLGDVVTFASNDIYIYDGVSGHAPAAPRVIDTNVDWRMLALGHFDAGTSLDLALVRAASSNVEIYLNDGAGGFTVGPVIQLGGPLTVLHAGDIGGDTRDDIAAASYTAGQLYVAIASASGFGSPTAVSLSAPQTIDIGDYDGDGHGDILLTASDPDVSTRLYPSNGDGTLGEPVQLTGGGLVGAAVGDFNGDGKLDVVASGGPGLRLVAGRGDGSFWCTYEVALAPSPYYWQSGDIDGDGRTDLVATNPNYSTLIHAISHPPGATF